MYTPPTTIYLKTISGYAIGDVIDTTVGSVMSKRFSYRIVGISSVSNLMTLVALGSIKDRIEVKVTKIPEKIPQAPYTKLMKKYNK